MGKVDNRQEQMDNESKEVEILTKNQKEELEIKNIVGGKKHTFDGLLGILNTAKKRNNELQVNVTGN